MKPQDFGTETGRELVAPRGPWSAVLRAGQVLTIVDVDGNQAVDFLAYVRGMAKFESIEALLDAIANDVKRARELTAEYDA